MHKISKLHLLGIAATAFVFFVPFLDWVPLFDWDEINFAEIAREMLITKQFFRVQIDFLPFWEKPPLFFWMQAACMKAFGINEFAARLPNAVIGILTLSVLYILGVRLRSPKFGLLWVLMYLGSLLPHFYFQSGLIDPAFNFFIFLAIVFLAQYHSVKKSAANALVAGVFVGLAVMTKGPVGLLLPFLTWVVFVFMTALKSQQDSAGVAVSEKKGRFLKTYFHIFPKWQHLVVFILPALGPAILWYFQDLLHGNNRSLSEFFIYQLRLLTTSDAGHRGPFFYHVVVLLLGCFPASVFFFEGIRQKKLNAFAKQEWTEYQLDFYNWMVILFWVVLLLFSIVKTKILHYSSLAYFPITFIATAGVERLFSKNIRESSPQSATMDGGQKRLRVVWDSLAESARNNFISVPIKWLFLAIGLIWAGACLLLTTLMRDQMLLSRFLDLVKNEQLRAVLTQEIPEDLRWSFIDHGVGGFYFLMVFLCFKNFKKNASRAITVSLVSTAVFVFLFSVRILPKVERYSQGAYIEFFKSIAQKDAYVEVLGYRSFAHYFYAQKKPQNSSDENGMAPNDFLFHLLNAESLPKEAFFSSRLTDKEYYSANPRLEVLYEKGGFVFYKRR